jgi:hypothetical protein
MSTNSAIGYMRNDGTVRAVYCHWDGYLSHVGKILIENYDLISVDDLLDFGNICTLQHTIKDTIFFERDRGEDPVEAGEFKSEHEMVDWYSSAEYYYILKDDKWYVSEHCAEFLPLDERLTAEGVKFTPYVEQDTATGYSARDAVVAMVADGVVEPVYMIKLLLDRIDHETLEELLKDEFHINDINPECYFEENE